MIEDVAGNLLTAKRLGMRTVLVGRTGSRPAHVDLALRDVTGLARVLWRR
jgi:putative hydrolase of the HAD superfamily